MPIRFHLDENVADAIAEGLRRRNIDVTTTAEAGIISASDEEQFAFCHRTNRVIITHDADFLRMHRRGVPHSGIAYFPEKGCTIQEAIQGCVLIWKLLEESEMVGRVEYL